MTVRVVASSLRTCFGTGDQTFEALLRGENGVGPLRHGSADRLGVERGYHILDDGPSRAGRWLAGCAADAFARSRADPVRERVIAIVGTGLGELAAVEDWALGGAVPDPEHLHYGGVLRAVLPGVTDVITLTGACSAGGHALALAQDLLELGEADVVLACAVDGMTRSMLAMIGRVAAEPTSRVRPFDADRTGVLLGEGAAAVALTRTERPGPALASVLATGLSCDARHETAPDVAGIAEAMRDALSRAARVASEVDVVVAHGTGTALNDPVESAALREVLLEPGGSPLVTAVKGAVGHLSGTAALVNVDVAIRCLRDGVVPAVTGLETVLPEGDGIRFVLGGPVEAAPRLVQTEAFGFGGANAVSLLEAA
ncbi:beta-ketoacyl synthase N-terminal-like domain-containing protein [Amycolatopsis minnesotensis]|uniref:Beta-ketoacyl-[acyl-carrier-protein] synthase family protein n=1 Tax=Amycolatopsis minnesotensis TaxID=337894 RepID=A0ABN2QLF8_9PSEU